MPAIEDIRIKDRELRKLRRIAAELDKKRVVDEMGMEMNDAVEDDESDISSDSEDEQEDYTIYAFVFISLFKRIICDEGYKLKNYCT